LQIPAFPVYTRSGEVRVSVEPALQADVRLSPRRARLIRRLQIPAFPVYTRSGEVRVSVEPALQADVRLSPRRARLIRRYEQTNVRLLYSDTCHLTCVSPISYNSQWRA
ncbi:jg23516, partial [Pararge aegeria aegeria]